MNIFIIAATHQLIQVNRAFEQFQISSNDALLLYVNPDNRKLDKTLFPPVAVQNFQSWTFREAISDSSKYQYYITFLKYIKKRYVSLKLFVSQYSSDYTLLAYSVLKPDEIFIMDEGTASFSVVCQRKNFNFLNWKLFIKSLVYKHLITLPKQVNFYSQYHLTPKSPDTVITYSFQKNDKKIIIDETSAIVLGTTLVELELMSNESYMEILLKIDSYLKKNGVTSTGYYAHRKEDSLKLKSIQNIGWNIVESTIPFELLFSQMDIYPKVIVSFLSPILDTISKQYTYTPELYIISPIEKMYMCKDLNVYKSICEEFKKNTALKVVSF